MSRTKKNKFSNSVGSTLVNDPMKPCEHCNQEIGSHDGDGFCPTIDQLPVGAGSHADDLARLVLIIADLDYHPHVVMLADRIMQTFFRHYGDEQFNTVEQFENALWPIPIAGRESATRTNYRREYSNKRREVERAIMIGGRVAVALRYGMGDIERKYRAAIINETYETVDSREKPVKKPAFGNDGQRADELVNRCAEDDVYAALELNATRIENISNDLKIYEAWLRREHHSAEIEQEWEMLGRRLER
jgi:hypothetical protein